ncbi:MAG: phospho-sugar mutase [Myxococcales bacterium]|nr:phospho-sugar mutase [Myxococcales bacterium]
MSDKTLEIARRFVAEDPDPKTRAAGQALLDAGDAAAIADHFGARLEFGTAGLRAALGPGPNRMNRAVVRRTTAGFGHYLLGTLPDAAKRGVAIGFDGRHGSREFAQDAAAVLAGLGVRVLRFTEVVPTPLLAFAVKHHGCAGGVMVTASHNPPADNGYKVYWADAAQIVPPHDAGISAAIDAIETLATVEVPALDAVGGLVEVVPPSTVAAYLDAVAALRVFPGGVPLRVVYTAMHGVGRKMVEAALDAAGYTDRHLVVEQCEPDPDFPTVAFPNPEEPGALDLALALAGKVGADLLIANDPDADRLAVAVPDGQGGYRALTGNQIGVLLADELLQYGKAAPGRLVATTVVSTGLLARLADEYGADYVETLTGFKWIAAAALRRDAAGGRFVFGFEEALGYSAGSVVRDKDGVSAALLFCDLAARCRAEGRGVLDRLAAIYRRHGLFQSRQHSLKLPGAEGAKRIEALMAALRADPPTQLAGTPVLRVRDLLTGEAREGGRTTPIDLPRSDVLAFDLADGSRALVRPSGTEPKIKFYFEVRAPFAEGDALAAAEARAAGRLDALQTDLLTRAGG